MAEPAAAGGIGLQAPPRRQRLVRGVAAAGALSLAVHAAVLLGRVPLGGAESNAAPSAPVMSTRLVTAPESAVPARDDPLPLPVLPLPTVVEATPEPPKVAVTSSPDAEREAAMVVPPSTPPSAAQPAPRLPTTASLLPAAPTAETPMAAPPAPVVTYQGTIGLDPPPRPLGDIDPVVPEAAGSRGGTVVLRLFINEQGTVDKAEVVRSAPPGLFDASALEAFSHARFSPGYLAGVPVKSQLTFEVKYRALGSGAETSGRTY